MQEGRRRFLERAGGIVAGGSLIGLAGCSSLEGFMGEGGGSGNRISYGQSVQGELASSDAESGAYRGYYDTIGFQGSAGDIVTITMQSEPGDPYLILQDPSGERVISNDDIGFNVDSQISRYTLQSSGQYTIIATSFNETATFPYTLQLQKIGEADSSGGGGGGSGSGSNAISYGQTVQGQLSETDPQATSYRGYHDVYEFQGSAGDVVTITMQSEPGDPYLLLENPDGVIVTEDDDDGPNGFLNSEIDGYELGTSGTYRIIATSYSSSDTFPYQISLSSGF